MKCANYMDFKAIRETVKNHEEKWGSRNPEDRVPYDLSDLNLTHQCLICDFGGTGSTTIDNLVRVASENLAGAVRILAIQEKIKELTGKPMKRLCFKEMK